MRARITGLFLLILLISTSCKKENAPYQNVNNWIQAVMEFYYFWNDNVPETAPGDELPESFYDSMLDASDEFSRIYPDGAAYLASLDGSDYTAGFSPAFGRFSNSQSVFIIVEFVYPDSPADEAGIERGDIILEINGTPLTTSNYLDLYYYDEGPIDYTLGVYDANTNSVATSGEVTLTKEVVELNPIVKTDVFEISERKVGYIFYSRFLSGDNARFNAALNDTLARLKSEGIQELIVDLRYNPGGSVSAAVNFSSALVPLENAQASDVLIQYQYNDTYTQALIEESGADSEDFYNRFDSTPEVNMGLSRVYFIATSGSASAIELIINGLRPYMDVVHVGENTYGKFYGAYVFAGQNATPSNGYVITPISFKYANANGVTDFADGLAPDIEAEEDIFQPYPLGDTSDPLINAALQHIASGSIAHAKQAPRFYEILPNPVEIERGTLLLKKEF